MWSLHQVDRILFLGGHQWVLQCLKWYHSEGKTHIKPSSSVIASVYGPMQCMLKGVCAQCFQWQIDPKTGQRTKAVFACSWQDEPAECIDTNHLQQRHAMNHMQRQLTHLWLDTMLNNVPKI